MSAFEADLNVFLNSELEPRLPFREHCDLSERMIAVCRDEKTAAQLIRLVGGSRSGAHAIALLGALIEFSNHSDSGLRLLLEYFQVCRLRCFFGVMISLLSRVNYLIQRGQMPSEQQGVLVDLCICALDMCEQLREDQWREGRVSEVLDIVEPIIEHGMLEPTLVSSEGVLLRLLADRARNQVASMSNRAVI